MDEQMVPSEIIEITSLYHYAEQFLLSAERIEGGERVEITLYDPQGFSLSADSMLVTGLGKTIEERASTMNRDTLPYPTAARVPDPGPYQPPMRRPFYLDLADIIAEPE